MIRRIFCLLLVLLMLVNQGLCFAHTHHGTDTPESEGHASQPHVHSGGHDHHHDSTHDCDHHADHSHGDHSGRDHRSGDDEVAGPPEIAPIGDHDADAVYFAEAVAIAVARHGDSVIVLSAKYVAIAAIFSVSHQNDDWLLRLSLLRGQPASVFDADYPIYLRTLSLRI